MSNWKPEVLVNGQWGQNALVFATEEEAIANARNLFWRWTLCADYRAVPSEDPVNYRWDPTVGLVPVSETVSAAV
jgi:hypothetical protein